jgi:hypothetical protein
LKEISNVLFITKDDLEDVDFSHVDFKDNHLIEYIDYKGIKHLIKNDGLPLGCL